MTGAQSIDVKTFATNYSPLTIDNFIFALNHIYLYITSWGTANDKHGDPASKNFFPLSGSTYNSQTGILSFSANKTSITCGSYGHLAGGTCEVILYFIFILNYKGASFSLLKKIN